MATPILALYPKHTVKAAFPGFNGRVAFTSNRTGSTEIFTMKLDGSDALQLTSNSGFVNTEPAWSPDGTKIAFTSSRDGNNEIYSMNADGSNEVRLTNNSGSDSQSTWSSDGTKIAFQTNRDGNNEVYLMNADGSGLLNITNNAGSQGVPRWSPTGNRIVYALGAAARIMNSDGTGDGALTTGSASGWSPDSVKITFSTTISSDVEIFTINADGSNLVRVTTSVGVDTVPDFSPDGTKIIFRSVRDGFNQIYLMNADGSSQTNLSNNLNSENNPKIQPLTILPVATNDSFSVASGGSATISILDNDTDTYGSPSAATVTITSAASHGSSSVNLSTGAITYTANTGYTGSDSLTYRVCSSESAVLCDTAVLGISVTPGLPVTGVRTDDSNNMASILMLFSGAIVTSFAAYAFKRKSGIGA